MFGYVAAIAVLLLLLALECRKDRQKHNKEECGTPAPTKVIFRNNCRLSPANMRRRNVDLAGF